MKLRNLFAVAVLGATSVALAQLPTVTTSTACTGAAYTSAAPCMVDGVTNLVAVYPEGLSLTVPVEIDFTLIKDQINWGNQPLTTTVVWNLASSPQGSANGYSQLYVDAYFKSDVPLTPGGDLLTVMQPTGGQGIAYSDFVGSLFGVGGQAPFGPLVDTGDPLLTVDPAGAGRAFMIKDIPLSSTVGAGPTTYNYSSQDTEQLKLGINFEAGSSIYPGAVNEIGPSGTGAWTGQIWVKAMAY
jgi:hypothetical protein